MVVYCRTIGNEARGVVRADDMAGLPVRASDAVAASSLMLRQSTASECELVICSAGRHEVYSLTFDQVKLLAARSVLAALRMQDALQDQPSELQPAL